MIGNTYKRMTKEEHYERVREGVKEYWAKVKSGEIKPRLAKYVESDLRKERAREGIKKYFEKYRNGEIENPPDYAGNARATMTEERKAKLSAGRQLFWAKVKSGEIENPNKPKPENIAKLRAAIQKRMESGGYIYKSPRYSEETLKRLSESVKKQHAREQLNKVWTDLLSMTI